MMLLNLYHEGVYVTAMKDTSVQSSHWGISAGTVKMIALAAMFIDHFAHAILGRVVAYGNHPVRTAMMANLKNYEQWLEVGALLYEMMRMIGRISFPIYCFFIVEGLFHTGNRKKYLLRLLILALISEIPFDFALFGQISDFNHQNVYFTLFIGLAAIWGINALRFFARKEKSVIAELFFTMGITMLATTLAYLLHTDYSIVGVLTIIVMYLLKTYERKRTAELLATSITGLTVWWLLETPMFVMSSLVFSICAISVLVFIVADGKITYPKMAMAGATVLCVTGVSEIPAVFAMLILAFYNGERGWNSKRFFYLFYPAHLAIIAVIAMVLGLIKFRFN